METSASPVVIALAVSIAVYYASAAVHKLFLHPLAGYPGPTFAALSDFWYISIFISGSLPSTMERLHMRYGDVVRVAPNELSFATPTAFRDIYSHAAGDRKGFAKSSFYQAYERPHNILSMRDPREHATRRKMYARAFSTTALMSQTAVVMPYVDLFAHQLDRLATEQYVDVIQWYTWLIFDITGELTFGTRA